MWSWSARLGVCALVCLGAFGSADLGPVAAQGLAEEVSEPPGPQVFASTDEGFGARAADGSFAVRLGGLLTMRNGLRDMAGSARTPFSEVRLARLAFGGHVGRPFLHYFLQAEFAGASGPRLLDAEVAFAPMSELRIRLGQFRLPVSRQFMTGLPQIGLTERSFVSDYFRVGRDTGIMAQGQAWAGRFEYYAGVFNGNGVNAGGNDNPELLYVARVVWAPLGALPYDETLAQEGGPLRMAVGVSGAHDRLARSHDQLSPTAGNFEAVSDPDLVRAVFGFDVTLTVAGLWLTVEGFRESRNPEGAGRYLGAGGFLQAGYFVDPALELVGRLNWLAPDTEATDLDGVRRLELGGNWYLAGNHAKLQLRYAYTEVDAEVAQLPAVATGHEEVLQCQLQI